MTTKIEAATEQVYVEIFEIATGEVSSRMGPMSRWKAEKVERGALINMSERYCVRTVDCPAHPSAEPGA